MSRGCPPVTDDVFRGFDPNELHNSGIHSISSTGESFASFADSSYVQVYQPFPNRQPLKQTTIISREGGVLVDTSNKSGDSGSTAFMEGQKHHIEVNGYKHRRICSTGLPNRATKESIPTESNNSMISQVYNWPDSQNSWSFATSQGGSFNFSFGNGPGHSSVTEAVPPASTMNLSPKLDHALYKTFPLFVCDIASEISDLMLAAEKLPKNRINPFYMSFQPELNDKMRTVVVDWLVDVCLKFRFRSETFYLGVNIMDRFLSIVASTRTQFQLVGITSLLLAAKYEEMWAPEVLECCKVTANTFAREEILIMERTICTALSFRFTVPTSFVFLTRLLTVAKTEKLCTDAAFFFLESATMNYNLLQYLPSHVACAAMYLAKILVYSIELNKSDNGGAHGFGYCPPSVSSSMSLHEVFWSYELQYYSKSQVKDFQAAAKETLHYCHALKDSKYTAIRRKYSSSKYNEISNRQLPAQIPTEAL